jgi:branched-chain amino acid transport system substrate-binding protein
VSGRTDLAVGYVSVAVAKSTDEGPGEWGTEEGGVSDSANSSRQGAVDGRGRADVVWRAGKRAALGGLAVALAVLVVACGDDGGDESEPAAAGGAQDVTLGAVLPKTGDMALLGSSMVQALEMARDDMKDQGYIPDNLNLSWVFGDDRADRAESIRLYEQFMGQDDVLGILGPLTSSNMESVGPIAEKEGVVSYGVQASAPNIPDIGKYVFTSAFTSEDLDPQLIAAAKEAWDPQGVAIIVCDDDPVVQSEYDAFVGALKENQIPISADEKCKRGDLDFRRQLTRIRGTDFDTLLIVALTADVAKIARQAHEIGLLEGKHLMSALGGNNPEAVKVAPEAMEGIINMGGWSPVDTSNPRSVKFIERFTERFGNPPTESAAKAYDGAFMMVEALKRTKLTGDLDKDRAAYRDAFATVQGYEGVTGVISSDGVDGRGVLLPEGGGVVLTVKDGKIVPFEQAQ